jgi:2-oxo-4-hydroxy-4-carboxy-5-ureidoimidazoline decarboxylase
VESLFAAACEASYDMSPADLSEALAGESGVPRPTPGPLPTGGLTAQLALRAAHIAYQRRFGHVFVICLYGCGPDEALDRVLSSLRVRLNNDPDEEWTVTAEELRGIALARLRHLVGGGTYSGAGVPVRGWASP